MKQEDASKATSQVPAVAGVGSSQTNGWYSDIQALIRT